MPRLRVLFIGGTGNISAECAALAAREGHEVAVLSRGCRNVPTLYRSFVADRKSAAAMRAALAGWTPEVVVNFLGFEEQDLKTDCEVFGRRIQQYVFISSATVYSKPPTRLPITEREPLGNPWWDYAAKKMACEQWLRERCEASDFPVTIVRPSHTYSKLWVPNGVSSGSYTFAQRLEQGKPVYVHDNGETPWTLTAASDFAIGLTGLLLNPQAVGHDFHITSDEALTWNQIYREIGDAVGAPALNITRVPTDFICSVAPKFAGSLKGDKSHPGVFDNSAIKRVVPNFRCQKPFRVGVRESVAWLREHPEDKNLNPELDEAIERVLAAWDRSPKSA